MYRWRVHVRGESRGAVGVGFLVELERRGIDAVAMGAGAGAVVETMAEVRVAAAAANLRPDHAVALVDLGVHVQFVGGLAEAGPAAAGIELRSRLEQCLTATDSGVGAAVLGIAILAGEGSLRPGLARDAVLFRGELPAPLIEGLVDLLRHLPQGSSCPLGGSLHDE